MRGNEKTRNNGFYIVLFTLVVLVAVCRRRWKRLLAVLLPAGLCAENFTAGSVCGEG